MTIKDEIDKLRLDARFGKDKHFIAADRMKLLHYLYGLPVIAISVFLGSAVFADLTSEDYQKIIGAILAFLSAMLGSVQTFFSPNEMQKGHRSVANRYLDLSRECRFLLANLNENIITKEEASKEAERVLKVYNEINIEAEAFPISKGDLKKAMDASSIKYT